jgi:hypothetical protein
MQEPAMAFATETSELSLPKIKPEALAVLPVGVASPLWGFYAGAALSGVAYWWMTQWMRPVNLEALFGAPATVPAPAAGALKVIEAAVEAVTPDLPERPLGGEAAPMSPVAAIEAVTEAAAEPAAEAIKATEKAAEKTIEATEKTVEKVAEKTVEAAAAAIPPAPKAAAPEPRSVKAIEATEKVAEKTVPSAAAAAPSTPKPTPPEPRSVTAKAKSPPAHPRAD